MEFDGASGIMNGIGQIAIEGKKFEWPAAFVEHVCRSRGMYGDGRGCVVRSISIVNSTAARPTAVRYQATFGRQSACGGGY